MSIKNFSATITSRYGEPERDIYRQVIELVKKNNIAKSRAQLLLVERGLQHTQNPESIIKTVVKEVPVEKVVYRDPPKVDKSTLQKHLGTQEHVGIEEHIIDEHIRGDDQNTGQRASKGQAHDPGQGSPPSSPKTALGEKKSLKKENGISGWAIGGGLGILGLLLYLIFK